VNLGIRNRKTSGPTIGDRCHRGRCRARLTIETVDGVMTVSCGPCDRNMKGLCRECPRKMETNPFQETNGRIIRFRCDRCTRRHASELAKVRYHRNPEHHREIRRRSNARPHVKAGAHERHRKWLEKNPQTPRNEFERELQRKYKRAWSSQYFSDPLKRAERNRKRREWFAKNPEAKALNAQRHRDYNARTMAERAAKRLERRKVAVLAGEVKRLTARDRQWLLEAGVLPISTPTRQQRSAQTRRKAS
jgi:hypothetical protein